MPGWQEKEREIPSEDNSAYCQARKRLPEKLLQKLFINVGKELESQTTPEDNWCGRHVKVIGWFNSIDA